MPIGYRITAIAEGYSPGRFKQGEPLFLSQGDEKKGIDIVLGNDGVALSGQVIDALGGPVAGADVLVVRWEGVPSAATVQTDNNGDFKVYVPPGGTTLVASSEGYTEARVYSIAPSQNIRLVLTPASTASGIVIDVESGRPIEGAEVLGIRKEFPVTPSERTARSGDDGRFRLGHLAAGDYVFEASAAGYRGRSSEVYSLGLADSLEGITIGMQKFVRVQGSVTIGSGDNPCREGMVSLSPFSPSAKHRAPENAESRPGKTVIFRSMSKDGEVILEAVPPGVYSVGVRCTNHILREGPEFVDVKDKDITDLRWRVDPGLGMNIRAVDQNGQPIPGATVSMMFPPEDETGESETGTTLTMDQHGRYQVPPTLTPGKYILEPADNYTGEPVEVMLETGMSPAEATIRLNGKSKILISVKSPEGDPIDDLTVAGYELSDDSQKPSEYQALSARPLGLGQYLLAPLNPGDYRVEVNDMQNPAVPVTVGGSNTIGVQLGQTIETTVVLACSGKITGRVVDENGESQRDVWVSVEGNNSKLLELHKKLMRKIGAAGRVLTDDEGRFKLDGLLPEASFEVQAERYNGQLAIKRGVHPGEDVELQLSSVVSPTEQLSQQHLSFNKEVHRE